MRKLLHLSIYAFLILTTMSLTKAQNDDIHQKVVKNILENYFLSYNSKNSDLQGRISVSKFDVDARNKVFTVYVNSAFAMQDFSNSDVKKIYRKIAHLLPKPYNKYQIKVVTNGCAIEELTPDFKYNEKDIPDMWEGIEYSGNPWISNVSRPNKITHGLYNKHISLWASHGMFYDQKKAQWRWQRPNLFGTTEDLFTQTIVVPYLIPMLENAGANVFTPRERDYQTEEIIIDNDGSDKSHYKEYNDKYAWISCPGKGFSYHPGIYNNGENPFTAGTARMAKATSKMKNVSAVAYQPDFSSSAAYAVYVSYPSTPQNVSDAEYIVYHKGEQTSFRVNQKMGNATWVYLGTFEFDKGCNIYNRVVVTNHSSEKGFVTTDAVRFGGGMGNIQRGGTVSKMPRCLEGARYTAQWYGAPASVYNGKNGTDDYSDDINTRSLMTNWLGGGSVYMPSLHGKNVPIELSLAVHSDAGYSMYSDSIIGSLSICTTKFNDGKLNCGISRLMSKDFAQSLQSNIHRDLSHTYKKWTCRGLYDKNYSETRLPEVPSAIIETLSHQNFGDMLLGHDPNFKFTLARAIYKTILRFVNHQHARPYIVQPLTPNNFRTEILNNKKVRLSWTAVNDELEPTATPTSYKVYTSTNNSGFDNGQIVSTTSYTFDVEPNVLYNFRITAVNRGGESFPTETLSAYCVPISKKTIMVINGFDRLSAPANMNNATMQGFDLNADPGVAYGLTTGWNGKQQIFSKSRTGIEGPSGLGYSGDEMAGQFFMGNDFNQVRTHAEAIAESKRYNIVSCSKDAIESGMVKLTDYDCIDLIFGLQKKDGHALKYYKTFTTTMRKQLSEYVANHGRLLVSGAYIGEDMQSGDEQEFVSNVLKANYLNNDLTSYETIRGLGMNFDIHRIANKEHYAATSVDILQSVQPAFCAMQYEDGQSAAVAYSGNDYRSFSVGFPIECIKDRHQRTLVLTGILDFLMK